MTKIHPISTGFVQTHGHTPDQVSVIVAGDVSYFLAGDTSYNQQLLLEGKVDGVNPDPKVVMIGKQAA